MKKPLSIVLVLITIISCNYTSKEISKKKEINNETLRSLDKKEEVKKQEKKLPIEQFLEQLQTAVKIDNVVAVENCLQFPFEFNSGGESTFYNNYNEIKEDCDRFSYILDINLIESEDELYILTYQEPNVPDYFVEFFAVKEGNSFKLKGFSQPH